MKNFEQIYVENLLNKIDKFYKSFYINKLIKGLVISFGVLLGLFLMIDVLFYYVTIPTILRYSSFYLLILTLCFSVYYWILIPIFRLFKITSGMSEEDASNYIGAHFKEIGDKLINTIQINKDGMDNALALAAIEQQSYKMKDFNFEEAAPKINSDKRLWFVFIPLSFLILLFFSNKRILTEGSTRFVNYEIDYTAIAPFQFVVNEDLQVIEGQDAILNVKLIGEEIPQNVYVNVNGIDYKTIRSGDGFEFKIRNIVNAVDFQFFSGKYRSDNYSLNIVKLPVVVTTQVNVVSPNYLNIEEKELINPSVLEVVNGSILNWEIVTKDAQDLKVYYNSKLIEIKNKNDRTHFYSFPVNEEGKLKVLLTNGVVIDTVAFDIDVFVINDEYPSIRVIESVDTTNSSYVMFKGEIQDDFGFHSLKVVLENADSSDIYRIEYRQKELTSGFSYFIDKDELDESVKIWFEVRDNDVNNGYKLSKSVEFDVHVLNDNEMDEFIRSEEEALKEDFNKAIEDSKRISKEVKDIQSELLNKNEINWAEKKRIEDVLKSKEQHNNDLKDLEKKLRDLNKEINKQRVQDQKTLDKQKQLEDLMNKLLSEENKELMKELQELLEKLDKEKLQEQLEKLQENQEKYQEELSRDLEIFKQMEVEQLQNKNIEDLEKLAKAQDSLANLNENKEISNEENIEEQDKLLEELNEIQKNLDELDSLNSELSKPNELGLDKENEEQAEEEMKKANENSNKGKQKQSSENQKNAAKKLEEMKESMENSLAMGGGSQEGEDLEALRKILENLLVLSFEQESVMYEVRAVERSDPRLVTLTQNQSQLLNDSKMVRDSLYALSVRVPQISAVITKEIELIENNMELSIDELKERRTNKAAVFEQKSLTSINNLAVLLDEIIQQMQEQEKNKNKGSGSCSKPGEGSPKPSLGNSKKKQNELAKKMEAMKKQLEKGKMPGKMNPGNAGNGMSMEVAKMAAQQEQIRNEIRKLRDELQKSGNLGGSGELKKLEELLDKNEEDLINFNLDNEFFERQKDIEVKMLEAENAVRERELDKKRKSNTAKNIKNNPNMDFDRYLKEQELELEMLRLFNPKLSGYYKSKVGEYNRKL